MYFGYKPTFLYKSNIFMSIPNVYPGPLRSVKQPGTLKTAQFLQKLRKIWKTTFYKNRYFYIKPYMVTKPS